MVSSHEQRLQLEQASIQYQVRIVCSFYQEQLLFFYNLVGEGKSYSRAATKGRWQVRDQRIVSVHARANVNRASHY